MKKLHKNVKKMKKKLAIIQILVYNLRGDRKERKTMKDITKEEAAVIAPEINARVKARLEEFKKNYREIYLCMSEGEYIEMLKRFHKEEGRKYLAEVLGW